MNRLTNRFAKIFLGEPFGQKKIKKAVSRSVWPKRGHRLWPRQSRFSPSKADVSGLSRPAPGEAVFGALRPYFSPFQISSSSRLSSLTSELFRLGFQPLPGLVKTVIGRLADPISGFLQIPLRSSSFRVHKSESVLGFRIFQLGRLFHIGPSLA